jgi:hypothetical protein
MMTMNSTATELKPVSDEDWEAQLPIPCGYHILVALPDIDDYYGGGLLLKTVKAKSIGSILLLLWVLL